MSGSSLTNALNALRRIGVGLLVLVHVSTSFAGEPASKVPTDPNVVLSHLQMVRDSSAPEFVQLQVAKEAIAYLQKKTSASLGENPSEEDIYKKFAMDPNFIEKLDWGKNKHSKETEIISELSDLYSQIGLKRNLRACTALKTKRGFGSEIANGTSSVSTVCEGMYTRKILVYTYNEDPDGKGKPHAARIDVPLFAWPVGIDAALQASNESLRQESYETSPSGTTQWLPPLDKLKAKYKGFPPDVVTALEVRRDTYERTLSKNLRNKLALVARFTRAPANTQIETLARQMVAADCKLCTPEQANRIQKRLLIEAKTDAATGKLEPISSDRVRANLCSDLKSSGYPFDDEVKRAQTKAFGSPEGSLHNTKIDRASEAAYQAKKELYNKRRKILGSLVQRGGDNLLILTEEMTELTENAPGNIKLTCDEKDAKADEKVISNAYKSAIQKTNDFQKKLNDLANPKNYEFADVNKANTELMKLSPKTFGEALMKSSGNSSSYACRIAENVQDEDQRKEDVETLKLWGVGLASLAMPAIGLAYGVGAAGTYVALAAGVEINVGTAALATGAVINAAYTADQWRQSEELRAVSEEFRSNAIGMNGDGWTLKESKDSYDKYQSMKWNAVLSAGLSAGEWSALVKAAATEEKAGLLFRINGKNSTKQIDADLILKNIEARLQTAESKSVVIQDNDVLKKITDDTNSKFLNLPQTQIKQIVDQNTIVSVTRVPRVLDSAGDVYVVELKNGMKGIYKPDVKFQSGSSAKFFGNANNEVVVSAVDDLYGFDVVPATTKTHVTINGKSTEGSFQLLVPNAHSGMDAIKTGAKIDVASAIRTDLIDTMVDSADRHDMNYLVRKSDGKVVAIDNGATMDLGEKNVKARFEKQIKEGKSFENSAEARIDALSTYQRGDVSDPLALGLHYSKTDVASFFSSDEGRSLVKKLKETDVKQIQDHLRKVLPGLDNDQIIAYADRIKQKSKLIIDYSENVLSRDKNIPHLKVVKAESSKSDVLVGPDHSFTWDTSKRESATFAPARTHVSGTEFSSQAIQNGGVKIDFGGEKAVSSNRSLKLELTPKSDISKIEVIEMKKGEVIATQAAPKQGDGFVLPQISGKQGKSYSFAFTRNDGSKEILSFEDLMERTPAGTRPRLTDQAAFKRAGFAGGHSEKAWNEILQTYSDRIQIDSQKGRAAFVKIPGSSDPFYFQEIYYGFDGDAIKVPKSVIRASDDRILEFERRVEPLVKKAFKGLPAGEKEARIPLDGGELVVHRIPMIKKSSGPSEVQTWFVNISTPKMKLLPAAATP